MYAPDSTSLATPIGTVVIRGDDDRVFGIWLEPTGKLREGGGRAAREAAGQIAAYFAGTLRTFDLPLVPTATPRGALLRHAIVAIAHGETTNYGELATAIGSSARAIGQACARNPFPLVVPCHRVLRAGGVLGRYSAGDGPATKRWLLDHERPSVQLPLFSPNSDNNPTS